MTYQEITNEMKHIQEHLINAGMIELIAPYFFININPNIKEAAKLQQLDRFAFLITLNEQVLQCVTDELIEHLLIQQMLHTCKGAQDESIRWRVLVKEVNLALNINVPDREYQLQALLEQYSATQREINYADGHIVAQACTACGYKSVIPNIAPFLSPRILCPMCEQDTCVQCS